jgi:hypothetical protein
LFKENGKERSLANPGTTRVELRRSQNYFFFRVVFLAFFFVVFFLAIYFPELSVGLM